MLRTLEEKIDPRHTAVIVVDVQNHFCHPEGENAKRGSNVKPLTDTVPRIAELVDAARDAGAMVVWVQLIHSEDSTSEARLEQWVRKGSMRDIEDLHCRAGTWNAGFYMIGPQPGEQIVVKHRYSAFIGTNLDLILRSRGIRTIVMTGFSSNVCVESTARDGFMLNYYVVFTSDCTATANPERHQSTLENMDDLFGEVRTGSEITDVWARMRAAVPAD
jgi:ureidoacrylate peracid hydrolase